MTNHKTLRCEAFFYPFGDVISHGFNDALCTVKGVILLALITGNLCQMIYILIARVFQALSHDHLALLEFSADILNIKTKLTFCQHDYG